MPVSNISDRGSRSANGGDGRWMSQYALMPSVTGSPLVSRGSPMTLNTWPSTPGPTGTVIPWPVFLTGVPRRRPSVGFMQMARTRLSPMCWATSAVMRMVSPSTSTSMVTA